jgi:hypothetical protein
MNLFARKGDSQLPVCGIFVFCNACDLDLVLEHVPIHKCVLPAAHALHTNSTITIPANYTTKGIACALLQEKQQQGGDTELRSNKP